MKNVYFATVKCKVFSMLFVDFQYFALIVSRLGF